MATVKIKFRPSSAEGKEGVLFFQVIHRRTVRMVNTGCHIHPGEWDGVASSVRKVGEGKRQAWLDVVAYRLKWGVGQLTRIIAAKEAEKAEYSVDDVVAEYGRLPECQTFFGFVRGMIVSKTMTRRIGTAKTYSDALSSFSSFRGGADITFDALDGDIISRYESWLKAKGLKRNTSSCYLRTLRTLYLKAVDMGLTSDNDIFRHVFTGFAKTTKRALPVEAIKAIRMVELKEGSALAFARDIFMLSLYLQGMSFVDMAYLKKSDIRNGLLQYSRMKTGQTLSISWEKPMHDIVETYSCLTENSPYLLPIITKLDGTERRQYEKAEHNVNRNLKKVGEMAGLHIPLTTYVARHSWASIMRDMGNDISIVSKGLGHEDIKTTQIYLSTIDTAVVMKANRKLLGCILK